MKWTSYSFDQVKIWVHFENKNDEASSKLGHCFSIFKLNILVLEHANNIIWKDGGCQKQGKNHPKIYFTFAMKAASRVPAHTAVPEFSRLGSTPVETM